MKKKTLLSLLLCIMLMVSAIPVTFAATAATEYAGGDGTQASPYLISNASELMLFRDQINAGTNTDKYFKLTADIDLANEDWTPIGSGDNVFKGNFAGNGHVISNITITKSATINKITNSESGGTESWNNQINFGFFASVEGTVTKLGLKNVTITPTGGYVGGFSALTGYNSIISSCFVENLSIKGYASPSATAGFSVRSYGQVVGCYIDGINAEINGGHFVPFAVQKGLNTWLSNSFVTNVSISTTLTSNGPRVYTFGTCSQNNTLTNCYSTFDTSALSSAFREATYVSNTYPSGTLVTSDALNSLDSSIVFTLNGTNPRFQVSNAGGAPLLLWEDNPVVIVISTASVVGGTVEADKETITQGEEVTVTATADEGYTFKAITANGEIVSYESTYTDTPAESTVYGAIFTANDPVLHPGLGRYVTPYTETVTEFLENKSYPENNPQNLTITNVASDGTTPAHIKMETGASNGSMTLWAPMKQKALALKHTLAFDFKYEGLSDQSSDSGKTEIVTLVQNYEAQSGGSDNTVTLKVSRSGTADGKYKLVLFDGTSTNKQSEALKVLEIGKWYRFVIDGDATVGQLKLTVYTEDGTEMGSIVYDSLSFTRDFNAMMSTIGADNQFRPVTLKLTSTANAVYYLRNITTTQEMFEYPDSPSMSLVDSTLKANVTAYYFDDTTNKENTLPPVYMAIYNNATNTMAACSMINQPVTMGTDYIKGTAEVTIDLTNAQLTAGTYKVKVFVWTDDAKPYTKPLTGILTVSEGVYTLN